MSKAAEPVALAAGTQPPSPTAPPAQGTPPPEPKPGEPPAPPPPEPEPPVTGREDPLLASLFRDLSGGEIEIKPVPEPKELTAEETAAAELKAKADADAKAKADAEAAAKAAGTEPPKPVAKKKKVEILPDDDLPLPPTAPVLPAAQQPPPTPREDPDAAYIASLTEEQVEELRDAQYAEARMGEK